MNGRGVPEDVVKEYGRLTALDPALPFRDSQGVGDLRRENVWGQKLVNALVVFVAKADRLAGIGLRQNPLESHRGIKHGFHWRSRIARMIPTALFCSP